MAEKLLRLQELPLTYRDAQTSVEVPHVHAHAGAEKTCTQSVCARCQARPARLLAVENYWALVWHVGIK